METMMNRDKGKLTIDEQRLIVGKVVGRLMEEGEDRERRVSYEKGRKYPGGIKIKYGLIGTRGGLGIVTGPGISVVEVPSAFVVVLAESLNEFPFSMTSHRA
ncbi:hypothetical protein Tco_0685994 [Tanacetum coccineum]